jgi:acetate kinase
MLYDASRLFGVSGISGDMRVLLSSHEIQAREAIDLFVFRVAREVGALVAILGGVDAIVFTAGIGENSSAIRRLICARLAWLGLMLDEAANTESRTLISASASRLACWVIPTDEESVIARHTIALLTCTK